MVMTSGVLVTVATALELLPGAIKLVQNLGTIITTNTEMTVDEEILALLAAKLRPSGEVVPE